MEIPGAAAAAQQVTVGRAGAATAGWSALRNNVVQARFRAFGA